MSDVINERISEGAAVLFAALTEGEEGESPEKEEEENFGKEEAPEKTEGEEEALASFTAEGFSKEDFSEGEEESFSIEVSDLRFEDLMKEKEEESSESPSEKTEGSEEKKKKSETEKASPGAFDEDFDESLEGTRLLGGESLFLVNKETGKAYGIKEKKTVIGRKRSCDIVLSESSYISRKHLVFISDKGRYFVSDAGSSNGSFVNGRRLPEDTMFQVRPGDEIKLADTPYVLKK